MANRNVSFYKDATKLLGGDSGKRDYDWRRQMAQQLMKAGGSTAPVGSTLEGVTRALSGVAGGYFAGEARREDKAKEEAGSAEMMAVLQAAMQPTLKPGMVESDMGNEVTPEQLADSGEGGSPDMPMPSMPQPPQPGGMTAALGVPTETQQGDQAKFVMMQNEMAQRQAAAALEAKTLSQIRVKQSGSGKDGKGETWGKTPVWGKDASDNPVLGVVSDAGNFKPLDTGSFNPERQGLQKVDAGDHWAFIDSRGQVVSTQKKRLTPGEEPAVRGRQAAQAAGGTVEGKTGAQARIDLPKLKNSATEILGLLDKIETHPGLSGVVGMPSLVGAVGGLRGTAEGDFNVLLDQVKGKQFMEAYQSLKGGGVITEVEGEKATDALARMNTAQTEEAFKDGLKDFRDVVNRGLIIAEDRARIGLDTTKQPAAVARATKRIKFDAKGNIIP